MNTALITRSIEAERPTLTAFKATSLPHAVQHRLLLLADRGSFDSKFTHKPN